MHGNGSSKTHVHQQDMGGWVRVFTDRATEDVDDLPLFLSLSLTEWFRQRPGLILQSIVPVTRHGLTVELHAWYALHLFADKSGRQAEQIE